MSVYLIYYQIILYISMSLQHLIEDVRKPWLNARVENLTVDGTINNHGHLKLYFTGISTNTTP
jgi:hypothetical protein